MDGMFIRSLGRSLGLEFNTSALKMNAALICIYSFGGILSSRVTYKWGRNKSQDRADRVTQWPEVEKEREPQLKIKAVLCVYTQPQHISHKTIAND